MFFSALLGFGWGARFDGRSKLASLRRMKVWSAVGTVGRVSQFSSMWSSPCGCLSFITPWWLVSRISYSCSENLSCKPLKAHSLKLKSGNPAPFTCSANLRAISVSSGEEIDVIFQWEDWQSIWINFNSPKVRRESWGLSKSEQTKERRKKF